jgi:GNAT superfamily N-acetyltransferase
MRTRSPPATTKTVARSYGVRQRRVVRGKVLRPVAVTALAAALLAPVAIPGVAALGGQIIGTVSTHQTTQFPEGAHVFGLWNLMVAEQARRMSIASALLSAAEHLAGSRGAKKVGLRVLAPRLATAGPPATRTSGGVPR